MTKQLKAICTPESILLAIHQGFNAWEKKSATVRSHTFGSLARADVHLSAALYKQYSSLGWFQMCLGRISVLWPQTFQRYDASLHAEQWASSVIQAMWSFTRAMWKHRITIVHGDNMQAKSNLLISEIQTQVIAAFTQFKDNPSILLARHHYLFTSLTVEQRLSRLCDNIKCWLRSIKAAEISLELHIHQQQCSSSIFFPVDEISSDDSTYDYSINDDDSTDTSLVSEKTGSTTTAATQSLQSSTSSMLILSPLFYDKKS
jgi:hypothetical protein